MSKLRRAHPLSIVFDCVKDFRQVIFPIVLGGLFGIKQNGSWSAWIYPMIGLVVGLSSAVLRWWRTKYQLQEEQLYVIKGSMIKSERFIRYDRIQSVHLTTNPIASRLGFMKVEVHTAGGKGQAELALSAVRKREAHLLKETLRQKKAHSMRQEAEAHNVVVNEQEAQPLKEMRLRHKELVIASITSSGLGVIVVALLSTMSQISELFENVPFFKAILHDFNQAIGIPLLKIIIVILSLILFFWLISSVISFFQVGRFQLSIYEKEWMIKKGLFQQTEQTIPHRRVQAVRLHENWLRQVLGYVTVYIECVGGQAGKSKGEVMLFPLVKKRLLMRFLEDVRSPYPFIPLKHCAVKRSFYWKMVKYVMPTCFIAMGMTLWLPYGSYAWGMPLAVLLFSWLSYRDAGLGVNGTYLAVSFRRTAKVTVLTQRRRMQALTYQASRLQMLLKCATIKATVIGSSSGFDFKVTDMSDWHGRKLYAWYHTFYARRGKANQKRAWE
ncbi:hypothetical protein GCM10011391_10800 [Pullulanibacillus camelliae]|uniref:YdbS-like PH domain-containing protein n=1 Tax=Pullulanibacillus camelliae TaxID=1707096 RepID=A0A8J2VKA6_9BACL|nr:PH domain-containing protein [Pullulanibacillus camelliae]GGE33943.1 hypothetical protein GCM10011391_10800 [Pullulanibacillus camelliae]